MCSCLMLLGVIVGANRFIVAIVYIRKHVECGDSWLRMLRARQATQECQDAPLQSLEEY